MGDFGSVITAVHQFLIHAYHDVNRPQGLLIALFAVVLMTNWRQLLPIAFGAGVVSMIVDRVLPVFQHQGMNLSEIQLPDFMQLSFWNSAASLLVGFMILIAMFFAVKKVVFMRAGGGKKARA